MQVRVTEKSLKDSGYALGEGDTITVPDEVGQAWCDHGWAKDVSGAYPTGERKVTFANDLTYEEAVQLKDDKAQRGAAVNADASLKVDNARHKRG